MRHAHARLGGLPADAPREHENEPVRDAVVIGGGIAGLAAAWDLRNRDVVVLEGSGRLGGRIRSEPRAPYWLNLGAHVFSGPGSATGRLVADVGVESVPVPGHLIALELNGRLLVGGRPELYPLRLPLRGAERVALMRAGARLRIAAARYRARRQAETRRIAGRDAPAAARSRRRPDVRRLAGPAPGRRRPDVPGHGDALDGRARGDHRRGGHGLLRARLELGLRPLAQHRRRRRRAHRWHRRRAGRARRHGRRGVGDRAGGRARARALPPCRHRARAARAARDRGHEGVRRGPPDPRPARRHAAAP